jgi:hypothetical protein
MRTRTLITALAATAASVAAAPAAHAEVLCVNAPTCIGTDKATPEAALVAAQSNGTTDIVRIGPKATPYVGGATYVSNEKVTIIGAGRDETRLSPDAGAAMTLVLRSPSSEVRDLTVNVRNASGSAGISLSGTAKNVTVRQVGAETNVYGVRLLEGGVLQDSLVDVDGGHGVERAEGTTATIRDSVIESGMSGVSAVATGAGVTIDRTRITAGRSPLFLSGSSTVTNVVARSVGPYMDSGIQATPGSNVVAHHLTLVGGSSGNALVAHADDGTTTQLTLRNSIVLGFSRAFAREGQGTGIANIGVSYSRVTGPVYEAGAGAITQGAGTTTAAPRFVDAGGADYRLRGDSPLIDAGDTQNVLSPDVDGIARPIDGDGTGGARADMGASEYRRQAPDLVISTPATLAVGAAGAFGAMAGDPDGDPVTVAWSFGDGATATGASATHAYGTGGLRTVTATATDISGLTAVKTAQVDVPAPVAGNPPVDNPPAQNPPVENPPVQNPPVQNPPAQNPPAKDRLAPSFKSLSASKKAVKFSLSEPAKVSVRVERAKGKRWIKVKAATTAQTAGKRSVSLKKLRLGKGAYRATVTAVDAAGNKSKPRTIRFRVK